jgi:hypothetical protein
MVDVGTFFVPVRSKTNLQTLAVVELADINDMPSNWSCSWPTFWEMANFDCERIIKLSFEDELLGLLRYGLYPYPGSPVFLEVTNLETTPMNRLAEPVGRWLLWYATQTALRFCSATDHQTLVFLVSLTSAVRYYKDKVQMELLEPVTIAPGEDGYAFRFSRSAAQDFCQRHQQQWGFPISADQ